MPLRFSGFLRQKLTHRGHWWLQKNHWLHAGRFINQVFLFVFFNFTYLFMAVLGLRFCARAFSSCGKRGPHFIAVRGPLTVAASLVAEQRLQTRRLSNCGSRAQLLCGMWDLPRPGLEPVSPASAGRLSTTAPPGKPHKSRINGLKDELEIMNWNQWEVGYWRVANN